MRASRLSDLGRPTPPGVGACWAAFDLAAKIEFAIAVIEMEARLPISRGKQTRKTETARAPWTDLA